MRPSKQRAYRPKLHGSLPRMDVVTYIQESRKFAGRINPEWLNPYDGVNTLGALIEDSHSLQDAKFDYFEKLTVVLRGLEQIDEFYAFLIIRRFGLGEKPPMLLEEIAAEVGHSDTWVHFRLKRAIEYFNLATGFNLNVKDAQKAAMS